jgi:hypothetical protein
MRVFSLPFLFIFFTHLASYRGNKVNESNSFLVLQTSCIYGYADKLDHLLTIERVIKVTGFTKENAKTKYSKGSKNLTYHSYSHSWESNRKRTMEVNGQKIEVPRNDLVSISGFNKIDTEKFNFQYRNLSKEEKEKIKKKMDEALENQQEKKELTTQQKDVAKDLGDSSIDGIKYEEIEGLGTKALWNAGKNQLIVHHIDAMFELYVDVSENTKTNKEKAIQLAQDLLAVCK